MPTPEECGDPVVWWGLRFEPALAAPFAVEVEEEVPVTIAPADPGGKDGPPFPEADPAITVGEGSIVSAAREDEK